MSQYRRRPSHRVNCDCGWRGERYAGWCDCYDMPCNPLSPGVGCGHGSGLKNPCPRCGGKVQVTPIKRRGHNW